MTQAESARAAGPAEQPVWLDSHCHLTADRYESDLGEVMDRAVGAGVGTMIAIGSGYGFAGNAQAVALARSDPRVFATVGVHPHEASEYADGVSDRLREWLAEPRVVAVGECGLDYHYMNSPKPAQRRAFAEQVALAREVDRPVSIHVRDDRPDAYEELLELWRDAGRGDVRGVLHCYTGTLDFARRALEERLLISFSGILTFGKSDELRDTARALPIERLMIETDAPFLAPQGHRGKRNEPAWVTRVGETLAGLHETSIDEVARITSANARRLFGIAEQ